MPSLQKIGALVLSIGLLLGAGGAAAMQQDEYARIASDMEAIRQLELVEPLDISTKDRDDLRAWLLETIAEDYPEHEQERDLRIMVLFGLAEPGTDLGELQVDLLGEQVAGFYDSETKELVVVSSNGGDELSASDEVTFAHEVVHALQDQNFDLLATYHEEDLTDDQGLAISALIEGDATISQVRYVVENPGLLLRLQGELESIDTTALDAAPRFIAETLYFPYDQGATFVTALYDEGGWEQVDAAYENAPQSTEQILHPEKYLAGEEPIDVVAVDPLPVVGDEWEILDVNVFGELITGIFLDSGHIRPSDAQRAAEGWGGDEYVVAANGDEIALVWATEWDSEEDAGEFYTTLSAHERNRHEATEGSEEDGSRYRFSGEGMTGEILLVGTRVIYVLSSDAALVTPLLDNQLAGGQPAATPVPR